MRRSHFLALCGILLTAIWVGRISDPSFWDETKLSFRQLFLLYDNFGDFFKQPIGPFDRSLGIHLFYLPFLWITGPSLIAVRVLNCIYFAAGVYCLFRVFEKKSAAIAQLSIALFLSAPIVLIYSSQYVRDPQLFAISAVFLYTLVFFRKRAVLLWLLGFLAAFLREFAIALAPATVAFFIFEDGWKKSWKRSFVIASGPITGFAITSLIYFIYSGKFFPQYALSEGDINLMSGLTTRWRTILNYLVSPYRLEPLIATAGICAITFRPKVTFRGTEAFCAVLVVAFLFVFSGHLHCLPRYFYSMVPFLIYLLAVISLSGIQKDFRRKILTLVLIGATFIFGGRVAPLFQRPPEPFLDYQDTWEYRQVLDRHVAVIKRVKATLKKGDTLLTSWPFLSVLESRYLGYGPPGDFTVLSELDSQKPPTAILWTNFPDQLEESQIAAIIRGRNYREEIFDYKNQKIRLFVKR
jgi:hypothetical protein